MDVCLRVLHNAAGWEEAVDGSNSDTEPTHVHTHKKTMYAGLARTVYMQREYSIFAGISTHIRSYTAYIYGSGQP